MQTENFTLLVYLYQVYRYYSNLFYNNYIFSLPGDCYNKLPMKKTLHTILLSTTLLCWAASLQNKEDVLKSRNKIRFYQNHLKF
jgi:hypothetical protein